MLRSQVSALGAALKRPVANAKSTWTRRRSLLLRVQRKDGSVGLGEAAPLPDYSPDSLPEARRCLENLKLFPDLELDLARIRQLVSDLPMHLPAARFAVETALLDLLGQERNQSISELLGADSSSCARCGLLDLRAPLASAAALLAREVHTAKLKIGRSWPDELRIIRALRQQHPQLKLRLDANAAWSVEQALHRIQDLVGLNIEFLEQPVPPAKMYRLLGSPVPLAADESMHSAQGREALSPLRGSQSLVAVVLKPTVLGGLFACMSHSSWARVQGLESIASHCYEGPVGTAAVAELAVATRGRFAAGVDAHDALPVYPTATIAQLAYPGIHRHGPGLGLRLPA